MTDPKAIAQAFFAAYNAHDVDGMVAHFTEDAQGRYVPYGKDGIGPIRGGIEGFWRGFPQAVPDFQVSVVEALLAEEDTIIAQVIMSGTQPFDVPGIVKKGEMAHFPHIFILRLTPEGKIAHLEAYWDNTALNGVKASSL